MDTKDVFTQEVRKALALRAINQLIADVEAGRLLNNKELTEVIAGCIRHADRGRAGGCASLGQGQKS